MPLSLIKKILRRCSRILQALCIHIIRLYQFLLSPLWPNTCRYYPSCSNYAIQAVDKYGLVRGLAKSTWRILRCNPFSHGGIDLP